MRAALAFTFGMFATGACGGSIATTGTNASQPALAPDSGVDGAQETTMVAGALGGQPFSGRSAFAEFISSPPFPVFVMIPSRPDWTCNLMGSHGDLSTSTFADSAVLWIMLPTADGAPAPNVGAYSAGSTAAPDLRMSAAVGYYQYDATCNPAGSGSPIDGIVHVSTADATGVSGDLDLTFANGERVAGAFHAPGCADQSHDELQPAQVVCLH
jgi:hypothetical protein